MFIDLAVVHNTIDRFLTFEIVSLGIIFNIPFDFIDYLFESLLSFSFHNSF